MLNVEASQFVWCESCTQDHSIKYVLYVGSGQTWYVIGRLWMGLNCKQMEEKGVVQQHFGDIFY